MNRKLYAPHRQDGRTIQVALMLRILWRASRNDARVTDHSVLAVEHSSEGVEEVVVGWLGWFRFRTVWTNGGCSADFLILESVATLVKFNYHFIGTKLWCTIAVRVHM